MLNVCSTDFLCTEILAKQTEKKWFYHPKALQLELVFCLLGTRAFFWLNDRKMSRLFFWSRVKKIVLREIGDEKAQSFYRIHVCVCTVVLVFDDLMRAQRGYGKTLYKTMAEQSVYKQFDNPWQNNGKDPVHQLQFIMSIKSSAFLFR